MVRDTNCEEEIQSRLSRKISELRQLEYQKQEIEQNMEELKKDVEAYQRVLEDQRKCKGNKVEVDSDWIESLKNLTNKKRLVKIAKQNGSKIRLTQATDLLFNKGFIKSKTRENAYKAIERLFRDMVEEGSFEKIGRGEYRLKNSEAST